jgi:hypothetical protein
MVDFYIVQVCPAHGWGEDYFYCYRSLDNARAKIAELAETFDMELLNPDFAAYWGEFTKEYHILEVKLSEGIFED